MWNPASGPTDIPHPEKREDRKGARSGHGRPPRGLESEPGPLVQGDSGRRIVLPRRWLPLPFPSELIMGNPFEPQGEEP